MWDSRAIPFPMPAATDGAAGWAAFVESAGRALERNAELVVPVTGLTVVTLLIVLADWRLARWLERVWQRRRARSTKVR